MKVGAMTTRTTAKIVTLNNTSKSLTFANARNIHFFYFFKICNCKLLT